MYGAQLIRHYWSMKELGLVRSKRDFTQRWLGRGKTYLRDIEFRGREWRPVSTVTTARLRAGLINVAKRSPACVAAEIMQVLAAIDRDNAVARELDGSRRRSRPPIP